jgi:hypothetical protein
LSTYQERFAEACKTIDFEAEPRCLGGYRVWGVSDIVKGGREQFDGPYFTEEEAKISTELWQKTHDRRCAREWVSIHSTAWNPCPAREKAIREDAMATRMILAELIGADIPKPHASRA